MTEQLPAFVTEVNHVLSSPLILGPPIPMITTRRGSETNPIPDRICHKKNSACAAPDWTIATTSSDISPRTSGLIVCRGGYKPRWELFRGCNPDRFPPDDSIRCRDQEREVVISVSSSYRVPVETVLVEALGMHSGKTYIDSRYSLTRTTGLWHGLIGLLHPHNGRELVSMGHPRKS